VPAAPKPSHQLAAPQTSPAKLAELAALVEQIREQVRLRHTPPLTQPDFSPVDLAELVAARDAAQLKSTQVAQVNPRPPGVVNSAIQLAKRSVARGLNWFVRDQIEFNHDVVRSLNATVVSLNETNRALRQSLDDAHRETHAWAQRLQASIAQIQQSTAEHRLHQEQRQAQFEAIFEDRLQADLRQERLRHEAAIDKAARAFEAETAKSARAFEQATHDKAMHLTDALAAARRDMEAQIHTELRLIRQRLSLPEATAPTPVTQAHIDWPRLAERFRGPEAWVRRSLGAYINRFESHAPVLDVGCGRGEALELLRAAGIEARGLEANAELAALCQTKGLAVESADAFAYLQALAPASLGGVLCSQMLEHLQPSEVVRFISLAHRALRPGGLLAVETPNPQCLAIFGSHFYLDPSHTRPVPAALMSFHMEEAGFGQIQILHLNPAVETMPALAELPASVREAFFGALDYAALAIKL
jgi:2-polyprenyl-3-methyl-5-hydroxy-6-metoxy-1,4-benzoquinol methylase